jgi:hypothetical protein
MIPFFWSRGSRLFPAAFSLETSPHTFLPRFFRHGRLLQCPAHGGPPIPGLGGRLLITPGNHNRLRPDRVLSERNEAKKQGNHEPPPAPVDEVWQFFARLGKPCNLQWLQMACSNLCPYVCRNVRGYLRGDPASCAAWAMARVSLTSGCRHAAPAGPRAVGGEAPRAPWSDWRIAAGCGCARSP